LSDSPEEPGGAAPEPRRQPGPGESSSSWAIRDFIEKAESKRLGPLPPDLAAERAALEPAPALPPALPPPLLPGATSRLDPRALSVALAPTPAPPRKRRWRRRLGWAAVTLLAIVVVARIAIVAALPSILDKVARTVGLTCSVERIEVAALAGELEVSHLVVSPVEGGESIVSLGWLRVDLGVASLLRGKLVLRRLEVDGLDLAIDRDADGVLALARRIENAGKAAGASPPSKEPEKPKAGSPDGDSVPAIVIEAVRIEHVHTHFRDASVKPAVDARLDLDVRLSDVVVNAQGVRPAHLEVTLTCPPVLDAVRIEGQATIAGKDVRAALHLAIDRLHLAPLAGYLAPAGIHPLARDLSFGLDCALVTRAARAVTGKEDGIAVLVSLDHVEATADDQELLALDSLSLDAPHVGLASVEVARLAIEGIRTSAERRADGALRFAGLELRPDELAARPAAPAEARPMTGPTGEGAPPETPLPRLALGELAVLGVRASFHDAAVTPAADLAFVLEALHVRHVVFDPAPKDPLEKDATLDLDARIALPGVIEGISIVGSASPFATKRVVGLAIDGTGVSLRALGPYLAKAGIESRLEAGTLHVKLGAAATIEPAGRIAAEATLSDLALGDGKRELAAIDLVRVAGVKVDPDASSVAVETVEVAGPRIRATREASGAVGACGLFFTGAPHPSPPPQAGEGVLLPPAVTAGRAPHFTLDRLLVHGVVASFEDAVPATAARLVLADAGLEVRGIDTDLDPAAKLPPPASLLAWLEAPGLAADLRVKGTLVPSPRSPSLGLSLTGRGITAAAAQPYLAAAGMTALLADGRLDAVLRADLSLVKDGPLGASVAVERLRFADGERELFLLEKLRVKDARLLPSPDKLERVEVGSLELGTLHGSATLEPGGVVEALGFALAPPATAPVATAAVAETPPPARGRAATPPILALGSLTIGDVSFLLRDATDAPALDLPVKAGVTLGPLAVDLASKAPLEDAPYRVALALPGIVESIVLAGNLAASPKNVRLNGKLETTGITARSLRGRLAALGIEPLLEGGAFGLELSARVALDGGVVDATAALEKVVYQDRGVELLGLDALRLTGVHFAERRLVLDSVEVARPRAAASRGADGAITAGGFRIGPAPHPAAVATVAAVPTAAVETAAPVAAKPLVIELRKLRLDDAALAFDDQAVKPRASVALRAGVRLDELVIGRAAPPATLGILVSLPGALDAFAVDGTVSLAPDDTRATLALDARGLRAGPLAPYLPPGKTLELQDGRFHAALEAGVAPCPEGGRSAHVRLTRVDYRDGPTGAPFFKLDEVRVQASRLDPVARVFALETVQLLGLEARVEKTAKGETRLLGLLLAKAGTAPVATPVAAAAAPVEKARREKSPLISLGELHLNVRELAVVDRSKPTAEPLVVRDLHVRSRKPIALLGPDPASQPAIELELRTEVAPVASSIVVTAHLAPFAQEPELGVTLAIDGLRGAGLTRLAPELADKLDGSRLTDGHVRVSVAAELRTGRRDALDFDLSRGFGADLVLKGLRVVNGPVDAKNQDVLAGLDELHVDIARVDSAGNTHIRAIEVQRPAGLVTQEAGGPRVLGLLLKKPPEAPPAPEAPAAPPPARVEGAEVKIDRIAVTDIGFTFRDDSCEPALVIPLTGLDLSVSQFTTKAFFERRAVRFDLVLKAGKIDLPKRAKKDVVPGLGFLLGKLDDVKDLVERKNEKKAPVLEQRPFFQEIAVKGELSFAPTLFGNVTASIQGLELGDFNGIAKKSGVTLEDGVLDVDVSARFNAQGDLASHTVVTLTDLDLAENADGPIQRFLHLPAPTNLVGFVLRDEDGAITIPLDVPVPKDGISIKRISLEAIAVLGELVAKALANSPFRALGQVGDIGKGLVDLVPGSDLVPFLSKPERKEEPVVIDFAPGDPALAAKEIEKLDAVLAKVRADEKTVITLRHAVGGGDRARESVSANPSREDRAGLIARLSSRRAGLEREREAAAADARRDLSAGLESDAASARDRLRALEDELAKVDKGLDQVYDLERDGAERQADRRTRAACVELASTRLQALRALLVARGVTDPDERIRVARPRVDEATGSEGGTVTVTVTARKKK
jgi:hypothetical protein